MKFLWTGILSVESSFFRTIVTTVCWPLVIIDQQTTLQCIFGLYIGFILCGACPSPKRWDNKDDRLNSARLFLAIERRESGEVTYEPGCILDLNGTTYRKEGAIFAEPSEGSSRRLRLALVSGSSSTSKDFRLFDSAIEIWEQ
jgi:hypothetical protein